jgi:hypothetical protein
MPCSTRKWPAKGEGTAIYGASDDLIEFAGDVIGEVGYYSPDDETTAALIVCNDGTLLTVRYGKPGLGGVWDVTLLQIGPLLDRIEVCTDEDADPYSDIAWFRPGLKRAYVATEWQEVK